MARVIQGFFAGGGPRPLGVAQPKAQHHALPGPPVPAFAGRAPVMQPGPPAPAFAGRPPVVQRHGAGDAFPVDPGRLGLANGGGRPLPEAVRGRMEAALGADFSAVRVHVGPQAERIGAIAFTLGSDIYFAPGRFQPDTAPGQQLLGHELAHVVQQRQGRVRNPTGAGVAVVQDRALEAEADRLGQRAATYPPIQAKPAGTRPVVAGFAASGARAMPLAGAPAKAAAQRWLSPMAPGKRFAMAKTISRSVAPPHAPAPKPRPAAYPIQRYKILGLDQQYGGSGDRMFSDRGAFPHVFTSPTAFSAQVNRNYFYDSAKDQFLDPNDEKRNTALLSAATPASMRLSEDGKMAIEDSNLVARQPKTFYATEDVIGRSNTKLEQIGSRIWLGRGPQSITVWASANRSYRLSQVSLHLRPNPSFRGMVSFDELFDPLLPQNCNAVAAEVMAWSPGNLNMKQDVAFAAAGKFAPKAFAREQKMVVGKNATREEYLRTKDDVAREYVENPDAARIARESGVNRHAKPETGEAYMIMPIGGGSSVGEGRSKVYDYRHQEERVLGWPYHFAGVVAVSGTDRITLENYARPDERKEQPDPRWYFQMYGEEKGQSFHEFHEETKQYANPVTITVKKS